ncbi:MAG: membrane dipeptidase [Bacteroidaceae bacterium]|nr:membrane dipeptidase [Bacteroidaceae bacterium]
MTDTAKNRILEESLRKLYGEISLSAGRKPLIGITGNFREGETRLAEAYWASVAAAGGIPVIIPQVDDAQEISDMIDRIDGLLLSGGADIDPEYLGEEPLDGISTNPRRDLPEMLTIRLAYNRRVPMLGICRGIQMLAAALGGGLYQDIFTLHGPDSLQHSQNGERHERSHQVHIEKDSLLFRLLGCEDTGVNSFHHQAVSRVPDGFRVTATAPDGIIEAMESTRFRSILGVQWHPECMHMAGDDSFMPIFHWLVSEASSFREARAIHRSEIILDSHCDTPMFFDKGALFQNRDESVEVEYEYVGEDSPDGKPTFRYTPLVSLPKMCDGGQDVSFMVAYLRQEARDRDSLSAATAKADRLLSLIEERIGMCRGQAVIARTPAEVIRNKADGLKSVVLGIENGYALGLDIGNVRHFAERGVSYITLCHNGDNDVCDSAKGNAEHNGLSEFGKSVIGEMNRYGIMIDLSHASEKSFYDALEFSRLPIICSHSSSRALCDHRRNLTDDQMKALAAAGGVAQVCLYSGFIRKDGEATIRDAVRHIVHMAEVMGTDHIGIGSDFDGGGGIVGLEDASGLTDLTRLLLAEGFSHDDIRNIWGLNFLRVWEKIREGRSL